LRYGSTFVQASEFLEQSQWWSEQELRAYQWRQISALLRHAYDNVPYYHRTWDEVGVSPSDIRSLQDMWKVPLLTKEQVKQHKCDLVAAPYRSRLIPVNTGGSTGQPFEFFLEQRRTVALERAFMQRQWRWVGFEYGDRTALLRGRTVEQGIAYYDPVDQRLFLSSFKLNDRTAPEYLRALRKFRPSSIQAYPSSLTILANYMKRHLEPPLDSLKVILAGSENLYAAQRALFEEAFQCRVYSWYGHSEAACLAGECELSNLYHVYSEYGYTELVDEERRPLEWTPGVRGEIVATGFNNWAMPLIRYCTGDIGIAGPGTCVCGRRYPLLERVEGRMQEYIVAPDGRLVPLTAFIFGQHYRAFDKIQRMQIIQDRPGAISIRLMVVAGWTAADEREFKGDMMRAISHSWEISFEYVDSIELTASGKHRFVIQNLPLPAVWAGSVTL